MEDAIRTESLTKYYGKTRGIKDVDLIVRTGEVFGFLGPNGAGKSTTIRLLLDFLRPTTGSASVLGMDARVRSVDIHRRVGYLPGELAMYERMTGRELLTYFGNLRKFDDWGILDRLAERLDLDLDVTIRSYSGGNKQKVAIVQAFMHEPELLILDEPTSGLDPLVQQEFYRMVGEVREDGRTVFLSSHILPEVERIADRVGIIRRGRIVVEADVDELKRSARRRLEFRFGEPVAADVFAALPTVRRVVEADGGRVLELEVEGAVDPVIKEAAKHEVLTVVSHDGDLEEAFLSFYQDDGEEAEADAP